MVVFRYSLPKYPKINYVVCGIIASLILSKMKIITFNKFLTKVFLGDFKLVTDKYFSLVGILSKRYICNIG